MNDTVMVDTYYAFVKIHRMYNTRSDPHVSDRLLLVTMYQYWFSNSNKCTIMQDVNRVLGGRKRECNGALYFLNNCL